MFDWTPDENPEWEQEPTREEIENLIFTLKLDIIRRYDLYADENLSLEPAFYCIREFSQHVGLCSARKCLEAVVFTAKSLSPEKYFYLFDAMLEEWLPEIN